MESVSRSGLTSLAMMARLLEVPVSEVDLEHRLGKSEAVTAADLLFLSRDYLRFRARRKKSTPEDLARLPLPAIVEFNDGSFHVLAKVETGSFLLHDTLTGNPEKLGTDDFSERYSGHVILLALSHDDERTDQIRNFGLGWFVTAFLQEKGIASQVIMSALIVQIFALATPLFTMIIIDKVFSSSGISTLEVLIMGLLVIAVFDLLLGSFRRRLLHHISNKLDVRLVARLFRHLTRLPMAFFSRKQTGDTISRLRELEGIRGFLTGTALTALIDFPFSIVFLAVMYLFSPLLTGIVLIAVISSFILYGIINPFLRERLEKKHRHTTDAQSFLIEAVANMETVKSMSVEPRIHRQWEHQLAAQVDYSSGAENLSGQITQIASFINKLTVAICLWIGAVSVLNGEMTAGQLIAFNMLVGRVMAPTQRIAQMLHQLQQVRLSVERVAELFRMPAEPALHRDISTLPEIQGRITFQNVSFRYRADSSNVLEGINIDISPGQVVGIVGRSGAGKTTLIRLIQRLYVPTKGKLLIDGINTAEVDPSWLRRRIGIVHQDARLLNRSVRENIALAEPGATMEQIESAAKLAGADEFIRSLPNAYDTVVGEGGGLLSAGQRQRIAIARALINDPKIVIFDEATSALDYESELQIQENLRQICEGRTVILIAHRLSTIRMADRILTIQNGRIAEDGEPAELLKGDGHFASLYALHSVAH